MISTNLRIFVVPIIIHLISDDEDFKTVVVNTRNSACPVDEAAFFVSGDTSIC